MKESEDSFSFLFKTVNFYYILQQFFPFPNLRWLMKFFLKVKRIEHAVLQPLWKTDCSVKSVCPRTREIGQRLRALAAFPEILCGFHSQHSNESSQMSIVIVLENMMPIFGLIIHYMWCTDMLACKTHKTYNKKINKMLKDLWEVF